MGCWVQESNLRPQRGEGSVLPLHHPWFPNVRDVESRNQTWDPRGERWEGSVLPLHHPWFSNVRDVESRNQTWDPRGERWVYYHYTTLDSLMYVMLSPGIKPETPEGRGECTTTTHLWFQRYLPRFFPWGLESHTLRTRANSRLTLHQHR